MRKRKYRIGLDEDENKGDISDIFEYTPIPISKHFPETWEIRYFFDFDKDERKIIYKQLEKRSKEKEGCDVFNSPEEINIVNIDSDYIMLVWDTEIDPKTDKEIGVIGILTGCDMPKSQEEAIDRGFVKHDILTDQYYFTKLLGWSCSFTLINDLKDHYKDLKKSYEVSVAKFVKIEILKKMKSLVDKLFKDYPIYAVSVFGCGIPSAIERHIKNGAKTIPDGIIGRLVNLSPNPFHNIERLCGVVNKFIYWNIPLYKIK